MTIQRDRTQSAGQQVTRARTFAGGLRLFDHWGLTGATGALFVALSLWAPYFLTSQNLLNVLQQSAFVGVVALAMTFVIVAGEIDISVGSAMAFSSALLGVLVSHHGWSLPAAAIAVLLVGGGVGLLIGFLRVLFEVPSFIVTLAFFSILQGVAEMLTNAVPIRIESASFNSWGDGHVAGVPVPAIIMFVFLAICWFVLTRTTFGRSVFAVGGNADAARLSGINVRRVRVLVFVMTGAAAALAGILVSAQLSSGDSTIGSGAEFTAISAVIIGGASLFGGRGSVLGTFLGVLFLGILGNGMVLLNLSSYAQGVARGLIVLLAVIISTQRDGVSLLVLVKRQIVRRA